MLHDYDDEHYHVFKQRQKWTDKHDYHKDFIPVGLIVAVPREDGSPWTHGTG